jgi:hypothetical protein
VRVPRQPQSLLEGHMEASSLQIKGVDMAGLRMGCNSENVKERC